MHALTKPNNQTADCSHPPEQQHFQFIDAFGLFQAIPYHRMPLQPSEQV